MPPKRRNKKVPTPEVQPLLRPCPPPPKKMARVWFFEVRWFQLFLECSPRTLRKKISNLTVAYFWNGLVQPTTIQIVMLFISPLPNSVSVFSCLSEETPTCIEVLVSTAEGWKLGPSHHQFLVAPWFLLIFGWWMKKATFMVEKPTFMVYLGGSFVFTTSQVVFCQATIPTFMEGQVIFQRKHYSNWKFNNRILKGGGPRGGGSLMFPKVPESLLGILRVPQEHPLPLRTL